MAFTNNTQTFKKICMLTKTVAIVFNLFFLCRLRRSNTDFWCGECFHLHIRYCHRDHVQCRLRNRRHFYHWVPGRRYLEWQPYMWPVRYNSRDYHLITIYLASKQPFPVSAYGQSPVSNGWCNLVAFKFRFMSFIHVNYTQSVHLLKHCLTPQTYISFLGLISSPLSFTDCGTLTIANGVFSASTGTTLGQTATLTCNTGYEHSGASTVECIDGGWNDTATCTILGKGDQSTVWRR